MNGYTPQLSNQQLFENEEAALRLLVSENPDNEYWKARLQSFLDAQEQKAQADEAAQIGEWLDTAETFRCNCILEPVQLAHHPDEMTAGFNTPEWFENIKPVEY